MASPKQASQNTTSQLSLIAQKKTTFTLPQELYKQLKIESARRDKEMSAIVTDALREYLSEEHE